MVFVLAHRKELICVFVPTEELWFGLVCFFFCPRAWTTDRSSLLDSSVNVLIVCDDTTQKCFWSCMPFLVLLEYHELASLSLSDNVPESIEQSSALISNHMPVSTQTLPKRGSHTFDLSWKVFSLLHCFGFLC